MTAATQTPPSALPVLVEHIPKELTLLDRWVCWRWLWRAGNEGRVGKWTKPPFDPRNGRHASHSDASTWTSFTEALLAYQGGGYDGLGFVLSDDDDLCAVDLDHVVDPESGEIAPWAQSVVDVIDSYTEISPSGQGIRILARGRLPAAGRKRAGLEMYETKRYVTLTGHRLEPRP